MTDVFSETEHPVFLHGKEICKWFTARTSIDFAAEEDHNTMMVTKFVMSCRQLSNLTTAKIFARKHTDIPSRSDDEGNPRGNITQCSARHTGAGRPSSPQKLRATSCQIPSPMLPGKSLQRLATSKQLRTVASSRDLG